MMPTALALLLLAVLLWLAARWLRRRSGLPAGQVIYSDTGAWRRNDRTLSAPAYQLIGKPDYLVRRGDEITPVEVKSGRAPRRPWEGHVLQLAAYCLLVEEALGARVTQGILCYSDKQFVIPYTPALKSALLNTLTEMQNALSAGEAHRNHDQATRCAHCGLRQSCDERLA